MRTEQLYYILEAAKTGSFSSAAHNLYLNPPSLRSSIIALEEELGYKIFDRHANGVTLTPNGKKILPKFYEIIQIYECLKVSLPNNIDIISEFRISLPSYQNDAEIITKSIDFLHRVNPLLRIKFLNSLDPIEQIDMLLKGKIDIAQITILPTQLENDPYIFSQLNHSWILEPIMQEPIVPIASPNHPLTKTNVLYKLNDFQPYTLIINSLGNKALLDLLKSNYPSTTFDIVYLSSSRKELAEYMNYNGIYFCPSSLLHLEPYANLVPLQLEKKIIFETCLAYRSNDENPFLRIYADFLRNNVHYPQRSPFL